MTDSIQARGTSVVGSHCSNAHLRNTVSSNILPGKSESPTAASFVPSGTKADSEQSFVQAVHQKYATEITAQPLPIDLDKQIEISGKVVEKVGFDKIRKQQSQLDELKIVIVDGFRISKAEDPDRTIRDVCPKIVELDLSRNLFETCKEIIQICGELDSLRSLRIKYILACGANLLLIADKFRSGNRLQIVQEELNSAQVALKGIKELEMNEMLQSWSDICQVATRFDELETLKASSNLLRSLSITDTFAMSHLSSLTLDKNEFTSLSDLAPISHWKSLEKLYLKGNRISRIMSDGAKVPVFGDKLHYVDLSSNAVASWAFLDDLVDVFPSLTGLRFSNNPIYGSVSTEARPATNVEEGYMLTVARVGTLKTLNFSNITPKDRENAEMFYLSRIGKALAQVPESREVSVTSEHKRFAELCKLHGAPVVVREGPKTVDENFVEGRLIKFSFHFPPKRGERENDGITKELEIPKSFDVYRVKGMVGRLFGIRPLSLRLIWETGEWDPVAGYEEEENSSDEKDEEDAETIDAEKAINQAKGKWMKREVEIEDGTRQVGHWVDGMEARVRVEIR